MQVILTFRIGLQLASSKQYMVLHVPGVEGHTFNFGFVLSEPRAREDSIREIAALEYHTCRRLQAPQRRRITWQHFDAFKTCIE